MRKLLYVCFLPVLLLISCQKKTLPEPAKYDSCLEFQVAVRMSSWDVKDEEDEVIVVSSNILPIQRERGPGYVISDCNGVIVEICWNDVKSLGDKGVTFTGFRWRIQNDVLCSDLESRGFKKFGTQQNKSSTFSSEFKWFVSPVSIHPASHTSSDMNIPPYLLIRCRWLPSLPKKHVKDFIDLRKYTDNL